MQWNRVFTGRELIDRGYIEHITRYLTSELRSLVRYRVEHEKIKFVSTSEHVIFCLLYKQQHLGNFSKFQKISEDSQNSPNSVQSSYEHFRSFSEKLRRCPNVSEDCRMFPSNRRRCSDHIEMNLGSFDN